MQALGLADINKIENVFLVARTAETDRGSEEYGTNPRVHTNRLGYFRHIGAYLLAQLRDGVHAADSLGKHGVGHKLRELRTPKIRSQYLLLGNPIRIGVDKHADRSDALVCDWASNQYAIGGIQILHSSTFGEELRAREDPEDVRTLVSYQNPLESLCTRTNTVDFLMMSFSQFACWASAAFATLWPAPDPLKVIPDIL